MGILKIEGEKIMYKANTFVLDDLYTADFLRRSDQYAKSFNFESYFVNELFLSTIQPYLALKFFIEKNNVKQIICKKPSITLYAIAKDISTKDNLIFKGKKKVFFSIKAKAWTFYYMTATLLYLIYCMVRIPQKNNFKEEITGEFIIIRTDSSNKKFESFTYPKYYEDIKNKNSLYSYFGRPLRILWVIKSYYVSFTQMKVIISKINISLGNLSTIIPYQFYSKRIVHTMLYHELLSAFFKENKFETLYTGNNLDRFSIIEEELTKKYGIKSIGIPHGLEYGFRFPKGFSTDLFYTTTENAAVHLNKLYNSQKFVFDQEIAQKIFQLKSKKTISIPKVVFFTESREVEVNVKIIDFLAVKLQEENIPLYVKLHPKDNENNYSAYKINYIDNLEDSLIGNICFARKSTTLLECIYNDSKAAAILINAKDKALFSTFPSLQTSDIFVSESLKSLNQWITSNLNNKNEEL